MRSCSSRANTREDSAVSMLTGSPTLPHTIHHGRISGILFLPGNFAQKKLGAKNLVMSRSPPCSQCFITLVRSDQ